MSDGHLINTIAYIQDRFVVPDTKPITVLNPETHLRLMPNQKLVMQYEEMKHVLAERILDQELSSRKKREEVNLFEYI